LISDIPLKYIMAPSSVHRPVNPVSGPLAENKPKKKRESKPRKKGLFGLLKGWTVNSQAISDELKE
jgi:hypothetical protein